MVSTPPHPSTPTQASTAPEATEAEVTSPVESTSPEASQQSYNSPIPPPKPSDPYAGLDSAFGGYIADQPRPLQGGNRPGEFDDLLL